jgi:hypothetical protein
MNAVDRSEIPRPAAATPDPPSSPYNNDVSRCVGRHASNRSSVEPFPLAPPHPPSQCIGASSGGGSRRGSPITSSNAWIDLGGAHDMSPTIGSGFSTMKRGCA